MLVRNPRLIDTALALHREAAIPPNTFVIDLDSVAENAALLRDAAVKNGLSLYFTTKQIGLNPLVARRVSQVGIAKALAIDFREAAVLAENNVPIGHVGHIVQIPLQMISPILELSPEVITVFSHAKAKQISQAAVRAGKEVKLLLRVFSEKDFFYAGQEGGIALDNLIEDANAICHLPNIRIAGVTSFPCLELDDAGRTLKASQNFYTILKAAKILQESLGIAIEQVNAPGNSCVTSMPLLAQMGATHAEPGHALTGTTYLHTQLHEVEKPAMVYISEVSHINGDKAYFFGGGTHRRAKVYQALVGSSSERMIKTTVHPIDPTAIDYYIALALPEPHSIGVGDSVVLASRSQVFITRSYVAVVQGIQKGAPELLGLFDALGRKVERIF
jgi:predicted amino acid racemase